MTTKINNTQKLNLRNSLEENINLYPETWADADALEEYVHNLWDAENDRASDLGEEFPTYPEYLKLHIELFWEIKENEVLPKISFELEDILNWYESGRFEEAEGNTIEYEASNETIVYAAWCENPNFNEDPENEIPMLWAVEGYDKNGNHWEGDDFEYLYQALEDLEMGIQ